MSDKDAEQAIIFGNRLHKRAKHLRKWAKLKGVSCYRLFDNDIPEIPLAVDFYEGYLHMALYERPYNKEDAFEEVWLDIMRKTAAEKLSIPAERVFLKWRKRQRGKDQYECLGKSKAEITIQEDGLNFIVNLADYLDTGLFLDHRLLRKKIRCMAKGRDVLNLFSYTGSFSVYAAAGGATRVVSVDISNTYQDWAERNATANALLPGIIDFRRADVLEEIEKMRGREAFDIIVLDPPTFSNSKRMQRDLDLNRDHPELIHRCLKLLKPGGVLYFSSNSRKLRFRPEDYPQWLCRDISDESLDEDFRDRKIHRAWELRKG